MFQAAIYCRVSVEETDREGEYSNSIYSQIRMAEEYISEQQDVALFGKYVDDGVSGSNFMRPEFRRMLADIELGKVNMVIIKDVSRLGREHIDTNYYLGRYFPERKVRIVSLLDHYDSHINPWDEMLDIKILMNDMYLRDTSKKIKSVIRMKRKRGEYTSKEPPYGYVKSRNQKNHLEVDPYGAEVVKRIYRMYLKGYGYSAISRILNEDEVLSPGRYKKEVLKNGYPYHKGRGLWSASSISNILKNPVYTGAIILRKTEKPFYKSESRNFIPLSEQELCKNSHEAIISEEQFEQVQQLRERRKVPYFKSSAPVHKYAGLLYCGKCGYSMRKRYLASSSGYDGYMCGSHQEVGGNYCALNHIAFEKLDELVAFAINRQTESAKNELKELERHNVMRSHSFAGQIENLQLKIERSRAHCKKAYEQYVDDVLSKEAYLELKSICDTENNQIQMKIEKLQQTEESQRKIAEETARWISIFTENKVTEKQLTRELLEELIGRIELYPDRQIDIWFHFSSPLMGS